MFVCKLADDDITSSQKIHVEGGMENVPIFRIFGLKLLSAYSRLGNKQGGIL